MISSSILHDPRRDLLILSDFIKEEFQGNLKPGRFPTQAEAWEIARAHPDLFNEFKKRRGY